MDDQKKSIESAEPEVKTERRDCLCTLTKIVGVAGVAIASWPLVTSLGPDSKTEASGAPIDIDLADIAPGKILRRLWQGKLILVRHRTEAEIQAARAKDNDPILLDPELDENRVKKGFEQWLVVLGNCPHAGCIPIEKQDEFIGWSCPCHGSEFDTSGRVIKGPASSNLKVPDYAFHPDGLKIRVGVSEV